ncbi:MAG: Gfo/Idh/MocA family oxidoreductase [Phycisphaerales bacterium]|nr:Gfo/Idh/MocA family oxidoreductase [Phycisphaerales bacterium]
MTSERAPGAGFIEHIPGAAPVVRPERHPRAKGVGVLGLHEGRTLLIALESRCAFARAVAGCDTNTAKIESSRRELPGLFYTDDYEAMLARPDVEIVAVYTPDHLHADHVERAFEAGKDVLCTKPLTNSLEGARRILESGRRTGRRLLVGQSTRFFEPFRRQRAALERGEFGGLDGVEMVDAHYIHRMDWYYRKSPWAATETDWVFLGLSHPVDLVRWYLGRIRTVHALGIVSAMGRSFGVQGRDAYIVNMLAEDGRIARVMGHYGCHELPTARNCIECLVFASGGTSLAQYHDMRYLHTGGAAPSEGGAAFRPGTHAEIVEDYLYAGRHYYFNSEVHGMHYGEFANYADHLASGLIAGEPRSPGLEEGVETVCVMEAIRRSAESGGPVEIGPLLERVGLA